jgi:hypothetical protein
MAREARRLPGQRDDRLFVSVRTEPHKASEVVSIWGRAAGVGLPGPELSASVAVNSCCQPRPRGRWATRLRRSSGWCDPLPVRRLT